MKKPLVLASSSPFRRMLMENAGLSFEHKAASIDERDIEAGLNSIGAAPGDVALALAKAKAIDVARHYPGAYVIGSDQTMSLGSCVYHKAADITEARKTIVSLSGQTHQLNSAVVVLRDGELLWEHVGIARMTVRPLSEHFIDAYLERVGDRALSSVGAYQLEGDGVQLFSAIDGDYFTVIGLPMLPLLEALRTFGVIDG